MNVTQILLSDATNDKEKIEAVTNIITYHELHLEQEQILRAFQILRDGYIYRGNKTFRLAICTFLLNNLLSININMYIALILALNDNFDPYNLLFFVDDAAPESLIHCHGYGSVELYCSLLDHYEFDVSEFYFNKEFEQKIQDYRATKYGGKLTKPAMKKK